MTQTTDIFLVRHGLPVLQNALLGSTDSPLSDVGWSQLENAVKSLENIDTIISSPLSRCAAFAQRYASDNDLQLLIDSQWKECFFGDWDGRTYQSLYSDLPNEIDAFFSQPDKNTPPKGEKLAEFNGRVENALDNLLNNFKGQRVALFTHAGVIRTLVAWCLKMDYSEGLQFRRFAVDYASITHLSVFHSETETETETETGEQLFPQLMSLNLVNSQMTPSQPPPCQGVAHTRRVGEHIPSHCQGEG
jgi:alpha-ribazole phosphatase